MVRIEFFYTAASSSATSLFSYSATDRREGLGWAYQLVMTITSLHALRETWNAKRLSPEERRLAARINQTIKAYARGAVRIEELASASPACLSIACLLQNGWRIRKLASADSCVLESN